MTPMSNRLRAPRMASCLLAASLAACGGEPEPAAAPVVAPTPVAAPVAPAKIAEDLVETHLAAFNAHDRDGAGAPLAREVVYFDATLGDAQRGREAAIDNIIGVYLRAMPDLEWELRSEPIATADGVAYEWTLTGTNTGTWMGIPATNQRVNIKGMSFVRVKDGEIVYKADYYDAATLNKQLGWQ
jgi:steroid delta-isomerase-like uncharacterized protein